MIRYREQRWSPIALPNPIQQLGVPYANFIHACSDALRRYCECLWYSGLQFKRPSNEEILANCGFLFSKDTIPDDLAFAFQYQLENMFAMSKVIHAMRSLMTWLDATETQAFEVISIFEMLSQIDHFEDTIAQHWKALQVCDFLLDHLGSIYFRVHSTIEKSDSFFARAIIDIHLHNDIIIRANHWCPVVNNVDPHVWQIHGYQIAIPSLLLEASTENGEKRMLRSLLRRFTKFLITCHGRFRRNLLSELNNMLETQKQSFIQSSILGISQPEVTERSSCYGLYVAKSRCSSKRWRSLTNTLLIPQPVLDYHWPNGHNITTVKASDTQDNLFRADRNTQVCIRTYFIQLLHWLHEMQSPEYLSIVDSSTSPVITSGYTTQTSALPQGCQHDVVSQFAIWWNSVGSKIFGEDNKVTRIIKEANFLKNLNQIMQMRLDVSMECNFTDKGIDRSAFVTDLLREQPELTRTLLDELVFRLGEQFYHPKSGQVSYRWTQKTINHSSSRATTSRSPIMHLLKITPEAGCKFSD